MIPTCLRDVRINSALLKMFPWKNGCLLELGPVLPWISENINAEVEPYAAELAKTLASEIDHLEALPLNRDPANAYVQSVLSSLCHTSSSHSNADQGYLGRLIFAYQFLDTLLWAEGWPAHPSRCVRGQTPSPHVSSRLERVIDNLDEWTNIIPDARDTAIHFLQTNKHNVTFSASSSLKPFITHLDIGSENALQTWAKDDNFECQMVKSAIFNLSKATEHHSCKLTHDVLYQWHSVAFCMAAFKPGTLKSVGLQKDLLQGIHDCAKPFDIHIPLDIVPPVALKHILQIAQLSFAISPLILLVPRNGATQSINKHKLLLYSHSLGNRPEPLEHLEKLVWRSLIKESCGQPFLKELNAVYDMGLRFQGAHDAQNHYFVSAYPRKQPYLGEHEEGTTPTTSRAPSTPLLSSTPPPPSRPIFPTLEDKAPPAPQSPSRPVSPILEDSVPPEPRQTSPPPHPPLEECGALPTSALEPYSGSLVEDQLKQYLGESYSVAEWLPAFEAVVNALGDPQRALEAVDHLATSHDPRSDSAAWDIIRDFATNDMTLPAVEELMKQHLGELYVEHHWMPAYNAVLDAQGDVARAGKDVEDLAACYAPDMSQEYKPPLSDVTEGDHSDPGEDHSDPEEDHSETERSEPEATSRKSPTPSLSGPRRSSRKPKPCNGSKVNSPGHLG